MSYTSVRTLRGGLLEEVPATLRARRPRLTRMATVCLITSTLVLSSCASGDDPSDAKTAPDASGSPSAAPTPTSEGTESPVESNPPSEPDLDAIKLRPLHTEGDNIVDDLGREVLLRGANENALGEYWVGEPDLEPTVPTSDQDFADMRDLGFSGNRLVVSWSLIEPERGTFDEAYLDKIDAWVTKAAKHGMYTVIDMHQDAYTAFLQTPDGVTCPAGTSPSRGWDGAPKWAVIDDGADTCIPEGGERNSPPSVVAAWNNFWRNTDGIRDEQVKAWEFVAKRFKGRPEVAGYDLLNEPDTSMPAADLAPLYQEFIEDTVKAIKDVETGDPVQHLLFIEPTIPAGNTANGIVIPQATSDPALMENVVAAPHNYAVSIQANAEPEAVNDIFESAADGLGLPLWIGEFGFFSVDARQLDGAERLAKDMDVAMLGGAWWVWRSPCGDPHGVGRNGWDEGKTETRIHIRRTLCPDEKDLGLTEEFVPFVGRGYPRAAPGELVSFVSDPLRATFTFGANGAEPGSELVVWTPTADATHHVETEGLSNLQTTKVGEGRLLTATVDAEAYSMSVLAK